MLREKLKNLFWSRVVSVQTFVEGVAERFEVGPDVLEAKEELWDSGEEVDESW